jgi:diphthamide synthase (EF-2-diphthine--ammonia ligase)
MTLAENQSHLLHALLRHGVEFVIVGGVAAQLRGWVGATIDLDIAVASNESNAERINRALAEVGLMKTDVGGLAQASKPSMDDWRSSAALTA